MTYVCGPSQVSKSTRAAMETKRRPLGTSPLRRPSKPKAYARGQTPIRDRPIFRRGDRQPQRGCRRLLRRSELQAMHPLFSCSLVRGYQQASYVIPKRNDVRRCAVGLPTCFPTDAVGPRPSGYFGALAAQDSGRRGTRIPDLCRVKAAL